MRARVMTVGVALAAALCGPLVAPHARAQDTPPPAGAQDRFATIQQALLDAVNANDAGRTYAAWKDLSDLAASDPNAAKLRDDKRELVRPLLLQALFQKGERRLGELSACVKHKDFNATGNTWTTLQDLCDEMVATDASFQDAASDLRSRGLAIVGHMGFEARPPAPPPPPPPPPPPMEPPVIAPVTPQDMGTPPTPTDAPAPPAPTDAPATASPTGDAAEPASPTAAPDGTDASQKPPADAELAALYAQAQAAIDALVAAADKSQQSAQIATQVAAAKSCATDAAANCATFAAMQSDYVLREKPRLVALTEALATLANAAGVLAQDQESPLAKAVALVAQAAQDCDAMDTRATQAAPAVTVQRAAVVALCRVAQAQWVYKQADPMAAAPHGFAPTIGRLVLAGLLDGSEVAAEGYLIEVLAASDAGFQLQATPAVGGGARSFFIDESGAVRTAAAGADAGPASDPTAWTVEKPDAGAYFEVHAIATLHTIAAAQSVFNERNHAYAGTLADLVAADIGCPRLDRGARCGFVFGVTGGGAHFQATARPQRPGAATRSFFVDETGTVRFTDDGSAPTAESPEVPDSD